jgi:hypothetical protein
MDIAYQLFVAFLTAQVLQYSVDPGKLFQEF